MASTADWLALLRPGDWLLLAGGLVLVGVSFPYCWQRPASLRLIASADGRTVAELPLDRAQRLELPGPLGTTVVEVGQGRARILADPSPRQYCVRAGWLSQAGDSALCLPNRTAIAVVGREPLYDSLSY
ncbi:NusG domain II-containing protein [Chitinimonas lacunae]|uniref:NusG domain II-containing protein n=1 Tax=Chitinimonas lacunae TaxID=1963018 RepID=A0ABV8MSC8_9NEIS